MEDLKDTNFPQKLLGDLAGNAFTTPEAEFPEKVLASTPGDIVP